MAMASSLPQPAPWREAFLSHVNEMDAPSFVLSTVHAPEPSGPEAASRPTPRARTVIFRGMWACLPVNPKNAADLNPEAYESDLPTITTDVRMEKAAELLRTTSQPDCDSYGGGPVEAVFWAPKSSTQWRIRGHAYIIGPDIDSDAAAPVRDGLDPFMRRKGSTESWSWSRELTAQFGNLSPMMRGTFRNPPPGTPMTLAPGDGLGLGQKVNDLEDGVARGNFRVLVICPEQVDRVDLTDPERGRRWAYDMIGKPVENTWTTTELWP